MNIYCENNICPICESKTETYIAHFDSKPFLTRKQCINNCFQYLFTNQSELLKTFYVFEERIEIVEPIDSVSREILLNLVKEKVKNWRKNDRYLAKIMGGKHNV